VPRSSILRRKHRSDTLCGLLFSFRQDTRSFIKFLTRSKELSVPIEHGLRRHLTEHCQGYPWLLKKLCVHVFNVLLAKPAQQRDLLDRALDVEALFKKDLSDLNRMQIACLERIAGDSPADHFKIAEQFGDGTVETLIHRRLIVRNSGKLVLYWDIFRDFVLSKQVPAIPARYIPVSTPKSAKLIMEACAATTSISRLCIKLGLEVGTVDNVARDLVMMGVCSYDRKNQKLRLLHTDSKESLVAAFKFFSSHASLRKAIEAYGKSFRRLPLTSLVGLRSKEFSTSQCSAKSIAAVNRRMVSWLQSLGILTIDGADLVTHRIDQGPPADFLQFGVEGRTRRRQRLFLGEAPPARVLEVLQEILRGSYVPAPTDRNALYVLNSLRLISSTISPTFLDRPRKGQEAMWLAMKVLAQPTIRFVADLLTNRRPGSWQGVQAGGWDAGFRGIHATLRKWGSGLALLA
jgi:hypothetical protein